MGFYSGKRLDWTTKHQRFAVGELAPKLPTFMAGSGKSLSVGCSAYKLKCCALSGLFWKVLDLSDCSSE